MVKFIPLESKPAHILHDCLHEVLVFPQGIGIVETQVGSAAELIGDPEIQTNRLGVTNVQVPVWLRGKPGNDGGVFSRFKILDHNIAYEIRRSGLIVDAH